MTIEDEIIKANCCAPKGTICYSACIFNDSLAWCKYDKRRGAKKQPKIEIESGLHVLDPTGKTLAYTLDSTSVRGKSYKYRGWHWQVVQRIDVYFWKRYIWFWGVVVLFAVFVLVEIWRVVK